MTGLILALVEVIKGLQMKTFFPRLATTRQGGQLQVLILSLALPRLKVSTMYLKAHTCPQVLRMGSIHIHWQMTMDTFLQPTRTHSIGVQVQPHLNGTTTHPHRLCSSEVLTSTADTIGMAMITTRTCPVHTAKPLSLAPTHTFLHLPRITTVTAMLITVRITMIRIALPVRHASLLIRVHTLRRTLLATHTPLKTLIMHTVAALSTLMQNHTPYLGFAALPPVLPIGLTLTLLQVYLSMSTVQGTHHISNAIL